LNILFKIILPILLLVSTYFVGHYLLETGPGAKKKAATERIPVVEVVPLKREDYSVTVKTSGVVKAGVRSNLVSEVSGRVISVSENFKEGSYFNKNNELVVVDKANYLNAVSIAESDVLANQASLRQMLEEQKSNQRSIHLARKNLALGKKEVSRLQGLWNKRIIARSQLDAEQQKMNQLEQKLQDLQGKQNTYASRRAVLEAKINSAKARLKQEKLNLSRTIVKAPYAGRVQKKNVDVGQFVSTGTVLGQIYATDYVNVELPLSLSQYALLEMPQAFRGGKPENHTFPPVIFSYSDEMHHDSWKGRIVRSRAALDEESRQMTVIARIDKPFEKRQGSHSPVRIGQYLSAKIKGKTFKNVFVLPPSAVRHNREILLLKDGKVDIVPIKVLFNSSDATVVDVFKAGQKVVGESLITTELPQAIQGMKVVSLQTKMAKQKHNKKGERTSD
jgi:multidrug efflux pump subunit AcrA (membrane-fusion protein)